jgi:protoporphyrinogen oxidase
MSEIVVIGAGPAGLTAACELSKLGLRATVLEADEYVGGLARTVNYRGYRFDIGGHRFFSKVPFINDLWHEILGEDFLVRPRLSRIYYRERFFDYPLKAMNALTGLGPLETLLILLSYARAKMFPSAVETNFEQWVSNRFGYRLYRIFFKTYTEKVWGMPCTEVAADWAAQRIKNLSLREALRNALFSTGQARDGQMITTLIDQFHYPRLGPGMMWERCAAVLAAHGIATRHGVRVERIHHRHGRVHYVRGQTRAQEVVEFGGDHFISTMPLRDLIHAMDPAAPDDVLRAANHLRYRDYLTVVLILNRALVFPDNWLYIHAPEVKVGRIQNYKNWSPDMVPDPSRTSLGLEYFLWDQDEEWHWPAERLIELGIRECAQIGLIDPDEVEDGTVVRMPKAYPVYDQQYHDSTATIRRYLAGFSNLQSIGRNGLHRYNNQDHSMLTGVYAARNTVGGKYDVWSVNTEMAYHEEGGVNDTREPERLVPIRVAPPVTEPQTSPEEMLEAAFARLDPLALGVAIGSVSGLGLFLATGALLLQGGPVVGPTLSLLAHYFIGFRVTWTGALIGMMEASVGGFLLGYVGAWLRNCGMAAYASLVQQRAAAEARRDLLDKV